MSARPDVRGAFIFLREGERPEGQHVSVGEIAGHIGVMVFAVSLAVAGWKVF